MTKPIWCLYYADGTTFSSLDGQPWESPVRPVVCVTDVQLQHSYGPQGLWCEYYLWHDGFTQWWPHTLEGLLYHLVHNAGDIKAVRQGRRQFDQLAQEIMWRAFLDREAPDD